MKKKIIVGVSLPTKPVAKKLTQEDVWGKWTEPGSPEGMKLISRGMIVAQGYGEHDEGYEKWKEAVQVTDICPVWGGTLYYKSVTVICNEDQYDEVYYWLEYVHGADCVSMVKILEGGKVAFRSDYKCW